MCFYYGLTMVRGICIPGCACEKGRAAYTAIKVVKWVEM